MMGTHDHYPMAVPIAGKELRQALITIMTPEAYSGLDIKMFISIIIMLLMMDINQGIEKHVPFVDYITIHLLSAGKEQQHIKGGMKDPLNSR